MSQSSVSEHEIVSDSEIVNNSDNELHDSDANNSDIEDDMTETQTQAKSPNDDKKKKNTKYIKNCVYIITKGKNKGNPCGVGISDVKLQYCKEHLKSSEKKSKRKEIIENVNKCSYLYKKGKNKDNTCSKNATTENGFCVEHDPEKVKERLEKKAAKSQEDIVADAKKKDKKLCPKILTKGDKSGQLCNKTIVDKDAEFCKAHTKLLENKSKSNDLPKCTAIIGSGKRKDQACGKNITDNAQYCKIHMKSTSKQSDKKSGKTIKRLESKPAKKTINTNATDLLNDMNNTSVVDSGDEEEPKPKTKKSSNKNKSSKDKEDKEDDVDDVDDLEEKPAVKPTKKSTKKNKSDDEKPSKKNEPLNVLLCDVILKNGERKGEKCNKKVVKNTTRCSTHKIKTLESNPIVNNIVDKMKSNMKDALPESKNESKISITNEIVEMSDDDDDDINSEEISETED